MKVIMKRLVLLLLCSIVCVAGSGAEKPSFAEIQSVYLLPMSGGLDQYLANRLTGEGLFRVVTDPQAADALFTDRLGQAFELKYTELYPPAPPAPEKPPAEAEQAAAPAETPVPKSAAKAAEQKREPPEWKEEARVRVSSFGRGKGTIFLVDRKTRAVLWSTFEKPKNTTAEEMDRVARRIAGRLKDHVKK